MKEKRNTPGKETWPVFKHPKGSQLLECFKNQIGCEEGWNGRVSCEEGWNRRVREEIGYIEGSGGVGGVSSNSSRDKICSVEDNGSNSVSGSMHNVDGNSSSINKMCSVNDGSNREGSNNNITEYNMSISNSIGSKSTQTNPENTTTFSYLAEMYYPEASKLVSSRVLMLILMQLRLLGYSELEVCTFRNIHYVGRNIRTHLGLKRRAREGWLYSEIPDQTGNRHKPARKLAQKLLIALRQDIYCNTRGMDLGWAMG